MNLQPQRRFFSTMLLSALFFMLLMPAANQAVYAQSQSDVTLTARAGFAGNCKENRWIPVRVTVQNKGADLNGRVQVAYQNGKGGQSGYAVDLSLPGGSRKEFFLYLYPDGYLAKLNVNLMVGDRVVETTRLQVTCIASESLIVGLLADNPSAFSALTTLTAPNGFTRIAPLQLVDLPDQPQGLEALDALIISGMDTGPLTDQQRAALKIWLAQGGKLLVVGGPNWQSAASGLDAFLPIDLNSSLTVASLSAIPDYLKSSISMDAQSAILAVGQLRPKATVLLAQDGVPVLVQQQIGFGHSYYLAADPGLQPLSTWKDMGRLYESLLKAPSLRPTWVNPTWDTYAANQAIAALPALGLPPTLYVFCLLGIYILVIGPINYLILRAIKRQEWAWVTIPLFVIGFTLVAYFSGYFIRGSRPVLNRLAFVQAWDNVDRAQAYGVVGLYSPGRTRYTLQAGEAFMAYPFDGNNQSLQANQSWLSLQQGAEILLPDVLVESGGVKSVLLNGNLPAIALQHNLVLTLGAENPLLSGTITNASKHTLKDAMLITPDSSKNLGDFAPGAVKQIQIALTSLPQGGAIYDFQGQSLYSNYSDTQLDDKVVRQSSLMRAMLSGGRSANEITSGIYLTGWLDEAILPTGVQGQGFDTMDTTFYMLNLTPTITFKPGEVKLTPELFTWASSDSTAALIMPEYSPTIPENGYVLSFKLAAPLKYSAVKSLSLGLVQNNYSNNNSSINTKIVAFLWDWESAAWVPQQNLVWGDNNILDPVRFVGPNGEIKLKISKDVNSSSQDPNPIKSSYFTLVVQP